MSTKDGGPAFIPVSLRDYFAAAASEDDIAEYMPATQGEAVAFLKAEGFPATRQWARYQHADAMLAEREREATQ